MSRGVLPRRRGQGGAIRASDLVVFDAGVVAGGYAAEVGRSWPVDPDAADPATKELQYQPERGKALPAHVYAAERGGERYSVTVVDYATAAPAFPRYERLQFRLIGINEFLVMSQSKEI